MTVGILEIGGFRIVLIAASLLRIQTWVFINNLKVQRQSLDHPVLLDQ
jgi:hypothetical protein